MLLHNLCVNLQAVQDRMKKYADQKQRLFEFEEGSWVKLKLHPYMQNLVDRRGCAKLCKKFNGPFLIF